MMVNGYSANKAEKLENGVCDKSKKATIKSKKLKWGFNTFSLFLTFYKVLKHLNQSLFFFLFFQFFDIAMFPIIHKEI